MDWKLIDETGKILISVLKSICMIHKLNKINIFFSSHFSNGNILNVHFYRLDFRIHARTYTKYFVS
jgi:hypothetical protein